MTNNDLLRSIRYLLNVSEARLVEIAALAGYEATPEDMAAYLLKDDEPGARECPHVTMAHFLNGLVLYKRGKDDSRPPQPVEVPVTNNLALKRLRVAFELKDTDLLALLAQTGAQRLTKTELSAFCRHPSHRNYRECGDQLLRNLLKALAARGAKPIARGSVQR